MFKKISVFLVVFVFAVSAFAAKGPSRKSNRKSVEKKYSYLYDTSLIQAIKKQDLDRVNFLLLANVSPNEKNDAQETPLSIAATYPSEEIIIKLLDKGADVNGLSAGGITPLMSAAARGDGRIINLLLEYGADANLPDNQGKTALMYAVENLNYDTVSFLLGINRLDLSATDSKGRTAFMYALASKDKDMQGLFLEQGIKVNSKNKSAQKLFLDSVQNHDMDTANMLLEYGLSFDPDDLKGKKALINAVKGSDLEQVEIILASGISSDITDNFGTPILTYAVKNNDIEMAHILLEQGANPNIKDSKNNLPLTYSKNEEMQKLLESYGAKSNKAYALEFSNLSVDEIKTYVERSEHNLNAAKAELAKKQGKKLSSKAVVKTSNKTTSKTGAVKTTKPVVKPGVRQTTSKSVTKSKSITKNNNKVTTTMQTNTIIVTQEGQDDPSEQIPSVQEVSPEQDTSTGNPYAMPEEQDYPEDSENNPYDF